MKRFLLILILLFLPVFIILGILFVRPQLLVNPQTIAWLLNKTEVFVDWSWKEARMEHEFKSMFHRNFSGEFRDFCFSYKRMLKTCLDEVSWDVDLIYDNAFFVKSLSPLTISSSLVEIFPPEGGASHEDKSEPPDLWSYWNILWMNYIPDMDVIFRKMIIHGKEKDLELDFSLIKTNDSLRMSALEFKLTADRKSIVVKAPPQYPLPDNFGATRPLFLRNFELKAYPSVNGIPLELQGALETVKVFAKSFVTLPLQGDFSSLSFRKDFLLNLRGQIRLTGLKDNLRDYAPAPYNRLPAPLNVMDGDIVLRFDSEDYNKSSVLMKSELGVDLKSSDQVIKMSVFSDIPVDLRDFKRGVIKVGIEFHKLKLQLPRLSKKTSPPQFKPDGRFKTTQELLIKENKSLPLSLHLTALNDEAMHIESNLLKEPLRLNFDLNIDNGEIRKGFVKALPLKTTVFKRPIHLEDMLIHFKAPLSPVIESTIVFPLPEYKVTMKIEGPMESPRYAFSSEPPLPENDIYAVLLFGRPMNELGTEDKTAASRTNQILAQGLLSLSTLYFLAGSPVEYVGYDPESRSATAQIGLGSKSSLRVGGGREGVNSTAIRRSLGKGWYLDTSVQDTSTGDSNTTQRQNYGVLLERIIAY